MEKIKVKQKTQPEQPVTALDTKAPEQKSDAEQKGNQICVHALTIRHRALNVQTFSCSVSNSLYIF